MNGEITGKTIFCSFCGKAQHEVAQLIAGPVVLICDECVVLCIEIVATKGYDKIEGAASLGASDEAREEVLDFIRRRLGYSEAEIARPFHEKRKKTKTADDDGHAHCSFCDASQDEVEVLVQEDDIYLCDECNLIALRTIATRGLDAPESAEGSGIEGKLRDEIYSLIRDRLGYTRKG